MTVPITAHRHYKSYKNIALEHRRQDVCVLIILLSLSAIQPILKYFAISHVARFTSEDFIIKLLFENEFQVALICNGLLSGKTKTNQNSKLHSLNTKKLSF